MDDVQIPSYSEYPEKHEQSIKQYFSWASYIGSQLKEWVLKNDLVEENLFILTYEENKIRVKPFTVFNIGLIEHPATRDSGIWKGRTNVIESPSTQINYSLLLLEDLINSNVKEQEFQNFFECNPQFLLLLGNYKKLHPQLILKEDNGSNLIPDFFMEKVDSDFCDILDLKRPTAELVRLQKNRVRFRESVMEAVAQLKYYRDWFDDKQNRTLFKNKYGLNSFKPQVVIVIGRKQNYYHEITKIQLETTLPRWVTLTTYDDIVDKVRQWKNFTSLY